LVPGQCVQNRETPGRGPGRGGFGARGKAVTMSRAGDTAIAAEVQHRRRVVVDVILLLMRNGRILLRERANTGYGDGAYEPPTGRPRSAARLGMAGRLQRLTPRTRWPDRLHSWPRS